MILLLHPFLFLTLIAQELSPVLLKLNSSLKFSLEIPLWTVQGIFLLYSGLTMSEIIIRNNDVFFAFSNLNPQKIYGPDEVPSIVLKNGTFILTSWTFKLFRSLCQDLSFLHVYIELVPVNSDCSNFSDYCPMALPSCLFKVFGTSPSNQVWSLYQILIFSVITNTDSSRSTPLVILICLPNSF